MNELTKLIEEAFNDTVSADPHTGNLCGKTDFLNAVNEILASRPTCGQEQRKFLDEVEKKYIYEPSTRFGDPAMIRHKNLDYDRPIFYQDDWNADLEKVIRGE
jgi:hypothetical protein